MENNTVTVHIEHDMLVFQVVSAGLTVTATTVRKDADYLAGACELLKLALQECEAELMRLRNPANPVRIAGHDLSAEEAAVFDAAQRFLQRHFDDGEYYSIKQIFRPGLDGYQDRRSILEALLDDGLMQKGFVKAKRLEGRWYLISTIGPREEPACSAVLD